MQNPDLAPGFFTWVLWVLGYFPASERVSIFLPGAREPVLEHQVNTRREIFLISQVMFCLLCMRPGIIVKDENQRLFS